MDSLWDCLAAMYPQYADTEKQKLTEIRHLKEKGVDRAEITRVMNKRSMEEEREAKKRRAMAPGAVTQQEQSTPSFRQQRADTDGQSGGPQRADTDGQSEIQ